MAGKIKQGSVVELFDTKGLSGYTFYRKLLKIKNQPIVVRAVKESGAILLSGINLGYNMFGEEKGLLQKRFKITKQKQV